MKKSFTLLELLIVIAIMGALALLISGNFITSLKKGRDARRKGDLEQIRAALEMYYEDNRAYPTVNPVAPGFPFGSDFKTSTKTYMYKVPNDPVSGKAYSYESTGIDYKLYACLENNLQILPYTSTPTSGTFTCTYKCKISDGTEVNCIWGISSGNTIP